VRVAELMLRQKGRHNGRASITYYGDQLTSCSSEPSSSAYRGTSCRSSRLRNCRSWSQRSRLNDGAHETNPLVGSFPTVRWLYPMLEGDVWPFPPVRLTEAAHFKDRRRRLRSLSRVTNFTPTIFWHPLAHIRRRAGTAVFPLHCKRSLRLPRAGTNAKVRECPPKRAIFFLGAREVFLDALGLLVVTRTSPRSPRAS
jgi:hypothetical protein